MNKFIRIFFMWLPLVAFFFLQFMLRVSPNVMADDILNHFEINATSFGLLMSLYYMGYAGMQIPIGLLLDMYGPRYIAAAGALLCALGGILFAYTDDWVLALLSRLMIGMGSSAAFISASKVLRLWFPEKHFSLFMACTVTVGLLGAFAGGKPTAEWVQHYGWQNTLLFICLALFLISVFIYACVQNTPHDQGAKFEILEKGFLKNFGRLMVKENILWVAFFGALLTGPLCAFADVWGVSYLVHVYGLTKPDAAEACSMIYVGMATGGPVLAILGTQRDLYRKIIALSGAIMALALLMIMFINFSYPALVTFLFVVGIFCSYQILVFALVTANIPKKLSGVMVGSVNTINMLSGLVYLPIIGFLLDMCWEGALVNEVRIYSPFAYKIAFSTIIIGLIIGACGFVFLDRLKKKEA
ncbi:MAG: MFS transporter [Alphaproteobacteria bacterium]